MADHMMSSAPGQPASDAVFVWRPPIDPALAKRELFTRIGLLGGGVLAMAVGIVMAVSGRSGFTRELVVVGVMIFGLGLFGLRDSKKARSTALTIDRNGTLAVAQAGTVTHVDLRTASSVAVRRRSGQPQWKWSIEAVTPAGGWHTELAPLASYWNQPKATMASLELELQRWLSWANPDLTSPTTVSPTTSSSTTVSPGTQSFTQPNAGAPVAVRGTVEASDARFVWTPARSENAGRNRTRFRLVWLVLVVISAVFAAASVWSDGLDAVVFSMFAPGLLLLAGVGIDRVFAVGGKYRVIVDHAGLSIDPGRRTKVTFDRSNISSISVHTRQTTNVGTSNTSSSQWYIQVGRRSDQPGDTAFSSVIPLGLGTSFGRNDAIALESELRRRCGLG